MFRRNRKKTLVDLELDDLFMHLKTLRPTSEEYTKTVAQIVTLHKLQSAEKPQRVSPDTWVMAGVNLTGIAIIVKHEQFNVVASKALSFAGKMR